MFSDRILDFYSNLTFPSDLLPEGVEPLLPHNDPEVKRVMREFYQKFYNDDYPRNFLIGINPGRLGAGLTGIGFTAPNNLSEHCQISHRIKPSVERSSTFIYEVINRLGGPQAFFRHFYFTSTSPVGFVKNGNNFNYYDDAEFNKRLEPWMKECLRTQMDSGGSPQLAISIGEGNCPYLQNINKEDSFFGDIQCLRHPSRIMQFEKKQLEYYVTQYVDKLRPMMSQNSPKT